MLGPHCWHRLFSSLSNPGPLLICSMQPSHSGGFSGCGAWVLGHEGFSSTGSVIGVRRPGCTVACEILLDQWSNLCLPHAQVEASLSLSHQGSPQHSSKFSLSIWEHRTHSVFFITSLTDTCQRKWPPREEQQVMLQGAPSTRKWWHCGIPSFAPLKCSVMWQEWGTERDYEINLQVHVIFITGLDLCALMRRNL